MFGFRKKVVIHRDRAADIFIQHCHAEAMNLKESMLPLLGSYCDGRNGRPTFEAVISRPLIKYGAGKFEQKSKLLLDVHCLAMVTAVGIETVNKIDPRSQQDVMVWTARSAICRPPLRQAQRLRDATGRGA